MRLDHLLSREPVLWGCASGARECVFGVCFLCSHLFTGVFLVGVGAWVFLVENRGASSVEANTLSGSRSTPFERLARMLLAPFWCVLLWGVWGLVVCVVGCL